MGAGDALFRSPLKAYKKEGRKRMREQYTSRHNIKKKKYKQIWQMYSLKLITGLHETDNNS
jgi:hypothetical protein